MRSKLKKKSIQGSIIFPLTFSREEAVIKHQKQIIQDKEKQVRKNRIFTKTCQVQRNSRSNHHRTLSYKIAKSEDQISHKKEIASILYHSKSTQIRAKSALKRQHKGNSSADISTFYYKGMEKELQKQCQNIIKQQFPQRSYSTYKIQNYTKNMMFIKKKPSILQFIGIGAIKQSQKQKNEFQVGNIPSIKQVQSSEMIEDAFQNIQDNKQLSSQASVSNQSQDATSKQLQDSMRINSSKASQYQDLSKVNQINYELVNYLQTHIIKFLSFKFSIKFITFFTIRKFKIIFQQNANFQLDILFQFYDQLIFKKISYSPSPEKKNNELRLRRGNLKKMQLQKQKMKQKAFSHLLKQGDILKLSIHFYQDLLSYLENYINLQHTYRGLAFIDFEQGNLQLQNKERLFQFLKSNKSYYFLLKLHYTFYFVKVTCTPQLQILFVFLIDFTTHSTGDQLMFQHSPPPGFKQIHYDRQSRRLFLKVVQQFIQKVEAEWKCERTSNKQIQQKESSAKISKVTTESVDKWSSKEVDSLWNVNKQYHMMGNLKNYFEFHNNFDYGFLNISHSFMKIDQFLYNLNELPFKVFVYSYKRNYELFKINKFQSQTLLIPHIFGQLEKNHAKHCIKQFFKRQRIEKNRAKQKEWIMYIGKNKVRLLLKDSYIEAYLLSSITLRCNKVNIPLNKFSKINKNQQIECIDFPKISSQVCDILKKLTLQKRLIYSRLENSSSQKMQIFYKGIQKFEGQYGFICLYRLPLHNIIQFKITMFRLSRQFIMRLTTDDFLQGNIKELVTGLLNTLKNGYFKKMLIQQAGKCKKRRLDALQDFLKQHGKSYVNIPRNKKKNQEDLRRRKRMASTKSTFHNTIYQNIISQIHQLQNKIEYYVTIRYLPAQELREKLEWRQENIQICVHRAEKVSYFKCVVPMKVMVNNVSLGRLSIDQLDFGQAHKFFRQVAAKIKLILNTSNRMDSVINRLRHFLLPHYHPPTIQTHQFKFKLAPSALFATKQYVIPFETQQSSLSIDMELQFQPSLFSSNNSYFPLMTTDKRPPLPSSFIIEGRKPVEQSFMRSLNNQYLIEVVSVFKKSEDYKLLREYSFVDREIWIIERESGCKCIVGQWQAQFVGDMMLRQSNKKMFKRLLRSLKTIF